MVKAILFDVDGTIVKGSSIKSHEQAFAKAFREIYGIDAEVSEIHYVGKTDKRILVEVLKKRGVPEKEIYAKYKKAFGLMEDYFRSNTSKEDIVSNPGIKRLLVQLKRRGHILGLLTGNLEKIAMLKIEYVGLSHFFELGSFGHLSEVRSDLVEDSLRKIKKINPDVERKDVYIIGDAPGDVKCGKAAKVKTIAVAAGKFSADELSKYHPTYLFNDFSDTEVIIKTIEE